MEEGNELQSMSNGTQTSIREENVEEIKSNENTNVTAEEKLISAIFKQFHSEMDLREEKLISAIFKQFHSEMDLREARLKKELFDVIETKFKEMKTGQDLSSPIIPPANVFGGNVPHWTIVKFVKKNRGKSLKHVVILVPQIDPGYHRHKWE